MYKSLSQKLLATFDKLKGHGVLKEQHVNDAMRDIRIALLEADVALTVVKSFVEQVKERAIGQEVVQSVNPAQQVVKIVHDQLVEALGKTPVPININAPAPAAMLMVGLQGSGKTTSSAKLASFLHAKHKKKVLLASLDVYRPAAQKQLEILANQLNIESLPIVAEEKPLSITKRAFATAKTSGIDIIILDTAGRNHLDDTLMQELVEVKALAKPVETLFVADSLTGQDAVNIAKSFSETVGISGVILTRADGDGRGGAALSITHVTGQPIKFLGVGERPDQFEVFDPDRIANRILDMGDVVALVEKASQIADQNEQEKLAAKIQKGQFSLNDMLKQLQSMSKMGGMSSMLAALPGAGKIAEKLGDANLNDKVLVHQCAIIQSMTKKERIYPTLMNASRRIRVAKGAGLEVSDVNKLLKQFTQMQKMFKKVGKLGKIGMMRHGLSALMPRR